GDPLHAEPGLVQYGMLGDGTTADLVAYVATNDGYLHAFNTSTGVEYFSFIPQEILPKLQYVFDDTGATGKAYGLDGNVMAWINDANGDGDLLDTDEHVYLYFGMRRGGRYIYSMDVTDRNLPTLRWVIEGGSGDYAELGQSWSSPNVEKIKTGPNPEDFKIVLIFGAGYDAAHDVATATRDSTTGDSVGRGIYIVDATTGALLWSAGPNGTDDLQLTDMKYSIPARIKPLDVDGDGYVDQLYAGDLGGQLWRFDINNAANTASTLSVTGGRIADLAVDASLADNRRFYNPPDVAQILEEGKAPYLAIIAASGYRAHPLQLDTHDRVYMIRDYDVYTPPADGYVTVTEADLFDTTDNAIGQGTTAEIDTAKTSLSGKKGWYITFSEIDDTFVGEKALSEPLILGGVAIFTTYIPASAGLTSNSCIANDGTGAIYFVNTVDGTPTYDNNADSSTTREDRRILLARGGIPPTPRVIITKDGIPTLCVGTECSKAGDVGTVQKMYWYEVEE
ncbi:MAG: pilus assembly protein PilY, partial [Gammaproteobacteria bacterium]|nr:pilus assembly protein PilY [Gammaproteobacteria bacterium]